MAEDVSGRVLVGNSLAMLEIRRIVRTVARNHSNVLICGESGTGKELVARLIHLCGPRRDKPFMAVNCSSIAKSLLESELFGHVKGAFTGAVSDTLGYFRAAEGGTVFLDEVAQIEPDLQAKLLRVLQEREIMPVGSAQTVAVNVRVIAATNLDVEEAMSGGQLREDFYYRLNVVSIELPPLRRRHEDLPLLVRHFLAAYATEYQTEEMNVHPAVMELFSRHDWPGNVRELENVIERCYALEVGPTILPEHLPVVMRADGRVAGVRGVGPVTTLEEVERRAIVEALAAAGGRRALAAQYLAIHRNRLARKISKYGLES